MFRRRPAAGLTLLPLLFAACSAGADRPPVTVPVAPPAVVLAHGDGDLLDVYAVEPHRVRRLGHHRFEGGLKQASWASRDELVVYTKTGRVYSVRAAEVRSIPFPPRSAWQARSPASAAAMGDEDPSEPLTLTKSGEIWFQGCPAMHTRRDLACDPGVWVRLRPRPPVARRDEPDDTRSADLGWGNPNVELKSFQEEAPRGFRVSLRELDNNGGCPITCTGGGTSVRFVVGKGEQTQNEYIMWVPGTRYYLVTWFSFSDTDEAGTGSRVLVRACSREVLSWDAILGPRPAWAYPAKKYWSVRHGEREVGRLRRDGDAGLLLFAP